MRFNNFTNGSFVSSDRGLATQDCINLYPEYAPGDDKSQMTLRGIPGVIEFASLDEYTGNRRGDHCTTEGRFFMVKGDQLIEIFSNASSVSRGTLNTNAKPVSMADNGQATTGAGNQMIITDGANGYIYDLAADTLTEITDPNFPATPGTVIYNDTYFLVNEIGTNQIHISDSFDGLTWPGFHAGAENSPDTVTNMVLINDNVWVFGSNSIQIFTDQGNAGFPYAPINQVSSGVGLLASRSLTTINDVCFFLGGNSSGIVKAYIGAGTDARPISDLFIEQTFQGYPGLINTIGWSYQELGHIFYVLNFPQANETWVYDLTTQLWHQRQTGVNRWRYDSLTFAFSKNLMTSYSDGKIYQLTSTVYTDNDTEIIRQRTSPHAFGTDNHWVFYDRFELEAKFGVGLDGNQLGSDPKIIFNYSNDGGYNWSNDLIISYGKIGQFSKRVNWNRLGRSRSMVFRIRITDPIEVFILGAWVKAREGLV